MLLCGVDLAADESRTSLCRIEWDQTDGLKVIEVVERASNAAIKDAYKKSDATGIDCPFGWPNEFLGFLQCHAEGNDPSAETATILQRERFQYRLTDLFVKQETGLRPLSVSTDKLGVVALRCAGVIGDLTRAKFDRSGSQNLYEVYPAASLAKWGIATPTRGYKDGKNGVANRVLILDALESAAGFDLGCDRSLFSDSHDNLDALLSALTAGLAKQGQTTAPAGDEEVIRAEGWIHLPADAASLEVFRPAKS